METKSARQGILTFDLPEESDAFEAACKAMDFSIALTDISNEIFRPARKHGYPDEEISNLLENQSDKVRQDMLELVGLLESKFYGILQERDLNKFV